jgi:hypothetical protein
MSKETSENKAALTHREKVAAERAERLRKQLRANLQRRKEQSRARKSDADEQKT